MTGTEWQSYPAMSGAVAPADTLLLLHLADTSASGAGTVHQPTVAQVGQAVTGVINVVRDYGADPAGSADSTTALQDAVSAAISAGGGVVFIPAGSYKLTSTVTADVTGVAVYIVGAGRWATTLAYYGSGDCLRVYDTTSTRAVNGGGVIGLTIDGTNSSASAASAGLHMGDMFQYEVDFAAQNFSGFAGSKCVWFDNQYSWTEQLHGRLYVTNGIGGGVVFDHASGAGSSSTGSFDRLDLDIWIDQSDNAPYDGVVFQNGANVQDGRVSVTGNFGGSASALTSAVLRITGQSPSGTGDTGTYSALLYSRVFIGVECDSTAANGPVSIAFGSSSNSISACSGQLNFYAATTAFADSNASGNFDFAGPVNGSGGLANSYVMTTVLTSFVDLFGAGAGGPSVIQADANNLAQVANPQGLTGYIEQSQAAATSPVTVTAASVTSLGSLSVPASDPVAGARYRVTAHGTLGTASSAPAATVDLRWGGTGGTLITSLLTGTSAPALAVSLSAVPLLIEGEVEFRTASTVTGWLRLTWRNSNTATTAATAALASVTSPVTVTVSSAEAFSLDWTWSATGTGTTVTIASSSFERLA